MSDSDSSKLLRESGVQEVPLGFRSSFRDWCADTGQPREIAEAALAHRVQGVEGAYFRSDLFERRRGVMEAWPSTSPRPYDPDSEDHCLNLRCGG